jgi:metal-dependent amidase/aminoacylase/carboxypeptidase family protein
MDVYTEICRAIDSYQEKMVSLSHQIHDHPEPKFREHFACNLLTKCDSRSGD